MKLSAIFALALILAGCSKPLKVFGDVPAFQLTDEKGQTFDSNAALKGHVWVADFVFTNCEATCPRMSTKMKALQKATDADVRLVSFSVDPDRDTPAALASYAQKYSADPGRWHFLTGNKDTLNALDRDAFKLGTISADIEHSTRFALVDKKGRIRGYYGIAEGNPVEKIAHDAERLEKEPA
jgi:cytochrome oxidase Cu insertion factor (SCO1/SenC/PrrC family)